MSKTKIFKIHISKKHEDCAIKIKAHNDSIKEATSAVYLGDIINEEGSLDDTIKARGDKSIGKISQVYIVWGKPGDVPHGADFGLRCLDVYPMDL